MPWECPECGGHVRTRWICSTCGADVESNPRWSESKQLDLRPDQERMGEGLMWVILIFVVGVGLIGFAASRGEERSNRVNIDQIDPSPH
jgi:hypothetical protein